MINLLPGDYKLSLHDGRLNIRLSRWLIFGLVIIAGMLIILGVGWLYMDQQIKNLNQSISTTQTQLKEQNLEEVREQADEISNNIKVINQVLSQEIRFSKLFQEIGSLMPSGTALSSVAVPGKPNAIDLHAVTLTPDAVAQIAVNLSDPKYKLFTKVDIVVITCSEENPGYKCTATLTALFDPQTFKRFLNVAVGDSQ